MTECPVCKSPVFGPQALGYTHRTEDCIRIMQQRIVLLENLLKSYTTPTPRETQSASCAVERS